MEVRVKHEGHYWRFSVAMSTDALHARLAVYCRDGEEPDFMKALREGTDMVWPERNWRAGGGGSITLAEVPILADMTERIRAAINLTVEGVVFNGDES